MYPSFPPAPTLQSAFGADAYFACLSWIRQSSWLHACQGEWVLSLTNSLCLVISLPCCLAVSLPCCLTVSLSLWSHCLSVSVAVSSHIPIHPHRHAACCTRSPAFASTRRWPSAPPCTACSTACRTPSSLSGVCVCVCVCVVCENSKKKLRCMCVVCAFIHLLIHFFLWKIEWRAPLPCVMCWSKKRLSNTSSPIFKLWWQVSEYEQLATSECAVF